MKFISKAKLAGFYKKYGKGFWTFVLLIIILVSSNMIGNAFSNNFFSKDFSMGGDSNYSDYSFDGGDLESDPSCNVQGISIHGEIYTYNSPDSYNDQGQLVFDETSSDDVIWQVNNAQNRDNIKAIIAEIDSPGGSPIAGEEIMRAFKESKKPVIAFIRNRALSTAYLGATGAQTIFASKFSDVGSIGVTMSYLQNSEKNKKNGLEYITLSSGKYKDSGSPDRALTQDEKNLFMRDIKISFEYFVSLVSQNRNLDIEKVRKLADGSSIMGEVALKEGLVDKIGIYSDVEKFVANKIGEEVNVCW
jgi:signal peptide peptidase SppA